MEAKKIVLLLVGLVAVIAIFLVAFWYQPKPVQAPADENTTQQQGQVTEKKITDETKPFKIDITYPAISGQEKFNAEVETIIQADLAEFKKISLENDQAMKDTDPKGYAEFPREYYYEVTYTKGEIDENVVSVVLNIQNYTGGAHGAHYFRSINWDVKNNREITLKELYPNQPNYLQTISATAKADLKAQIKNRLSGVEDGGWIDDGAAPTEENFSVFLVNKESITFYFPEYQVAAYALGDFQVTIPR